MNLRLLIQQLTTASLDWDNASPTNVYDISYSSDGGLTWIDITSHTGSYINLTDLSPSTTYEIEITSTAYGCESEVFSSSFTTGVDCIVPENISLTATPFEVTLSWDALDGADSYNILFIIYLVLVGRLQLLPITSLLYHMMVMV